MSESLPEPVLHRIPCTCPRASDCSLRCYAHFPTIPSPNPTTSHSSAQSSRLLLKQHIRTTFDHLHSLFQSFISSISTSTRRPDRDAGHLSRLGSYSRSSTAEDIPSSHIPTLVLQSLHTLLNRCRNRIQRLNSLIAEPAKDEDPEAIPMFHLTVLFSALIRDYEFFLVDLVPYYREDWAEGRDKTEATSTAPLHVYNKRERVNLVTVINELEK
ncbi:hypothetical protein NCU12099 [Neurospora crassa OR74A]|uniref:Uncharacterized protein n=1 Tax=Neurospora crassa (strain ATCC 24698 / 74-OR23-1A / CBS 708.71 / DSM 1257 / FGSC 987) TaxID=367110 RepID=V5ILF6_NEUCR|nr:hypothetical protein NCU12099 [Neurospora crassa OR74A]ESA42190.1 hypothetical protein NCU12099 [Neurospora crassa OR74A]|eukprot:XP_011395047.1 hypothetical protein NCU12099 [Neurospora crassa OR74A]